MTILIGIFLLGILVLVHEFGHFFAARFFKVEVQAFSIGMGPVLLHKKIKDTDWRLSLFPFGGYCLMKGEKNPEDEIPASDENSFSALKPLKKAVIGFAGPFANVLFSFLAYFIIAFSGYSYFAADSSVVIASELYPEIHSSAAEAGIKTGDKVLSINKKDISDFSELYFEVASHPDEDLAFVIDRNGEILNFTVHTDLNKDSGEGKIGVAASADSVVKREIPGLGFFPSVKKGITDTASSFVLTVKSFGILFKGVNLSKSIQGPVGISSMLGKTAKAGFSSGARNGFASILEILAMIGISLFIMNLLPIPVLDGYLVITSLVEAVFGIQVSPKVRNIVQYIGISILVFLFLFATYGDFISFRGK